MSNQTFDWIANRYRCLKVNQTSPSFYDDSLTFYETLCKLMAAVLELYEMDEDLVHWGELQPILNEIDRHLLTLDTNLANAIADYNAKIKDLKAYFDADQIRQTQELQQYAQALVSNARAELMKLIQAGDDANRAYIDWEVAKLKAYVDALVCKFDRNVFDPTSGKCEDVGIVVNRVYHWLRYGAADCTEWNIAGKTASVLDGYGMTAKEYDLYDKNVILFDFNHGGFSPVTGELCSYQVMIDQLANFHRADWNAAGYDAKGYTAQGYEDMAWTAYYFDYTNYTGS